MIPPLTGIIAYGYFKKIQDYKNYNRTASEDLSEVIKLRQDLLNKIHRIIPVA